MKNLDITNIDKRIGDALRRFRHSNMLSENELANLVGISQQQISRYERGETKMTVSMLVKILCVFNVSLDKFFYIFIHCHTDNINKEEV